MKAALYTRVSTQEQVKEGHSLDAQLERLTKYAEFQGYETLPPFIDDGYSGASMNRPALQRLIEAVKGREVNVIVIYKLDRLSRRVRDVLDLVEMFDEYSVTLYSLTENLDLSSPFGRAALKMSATFSELERETIKERMLMGKDMRVRQGHMLPTRVAPFGYRYDLNEKRFLVVPEEADIVRKLFELYISGKYNFRQLHDYARETYGHPYFGNNPLSCKPIIHRIMYAGYILYKGELYKGENFDPVIDYQTYLQAQEVSKRHRTQRNTENSPYLLTGLLICARCGNRYVGKLYDRNVTRKSGITTTKYRYRAYGCAARVKRDKRYHPALCDNDIYPADKLDQLIETQLRKLKFSDYVASADNRIDPLILENIELKKRARKLLDLYLEDGMTKEDYILRKDKIDKQLSNNQKIIESEQQKSTRPNTTIETLKDRIRNYDTLDRVEKQRLCRLLIDYISIDGQKINIKWRVK